MRILKAACHRHHIELVVCRQQQALGHVEPTTNELHIDWTTKMLLEERV
jgi:hypothetical protein